MRHLRPSSLIAGDQPGLHETLVQIQRNISELKDTLSALPSNRRSQSLPHRANEVC